MMKRRLQQAAAVVLRRLGPVDGIAAVQPMPTRAGVVGLLGLREDHEYARTRMQQRGETIQRLSRSSPANSSPEALEGYVSEAALRFFHTMEWLGESLRELALQRSRLLEIGSNPYFLTVLIAERFPRVEHLGVNYFGAAVPTMETQAIADAKGRLAESRFFHADIERHDLAPTGEFDVALFCEVLEHLPYDPAWALYNIARRLRRGGHLILSTPNPARFDNIVRLVERRETFSDPISGFGIHGRHNREYSAAELQEMLVGTGFRSVHAATIDVLPEPQSRDAEARGYGAYHILRGVLEGEARLFRPSWLYRSFPPDALARTQSLAPGAG